MKELVFLILILILFSCQTAAPKEEDYLDGIDYSHFQRDSLVANDSLKFEGKLGDVDIIVHLNVRSISNEIRLSGDLIHKLVGVRIPLSGTINNNNVVYLYEHAFEKLAGTWEGSISENSFTGSWMSDTISQKGHSLLFNLKVTNDLLKDYEKEFKGLYGIYDFYGSHFIDSYPSIIVLPNEENKNNLDLKITTIEEEFGGDFGEMLFENVELKNNTVSVRYDKGKNHIKFNLLFLNNKIEVQRFWEIHREDWVDKRKDKHTFFKEINLDTEFPKELGKRYGLQ